MKKDRLAAIVKACIFIVLCISGIIITANSSLVAPTSTIIILILVLLAITTLVLTIGDMVIYYSETSEFLNDDQRQGRTTVNGPLSFLYQRELTLEEKQANNVDKIPDKKKKKSRWYLWVIIIILLGIIISQGTKYFNTGTDMYNKSKSLHALYMQKTQEKAGFYDKLWKTYLQKEKITNLNRETFLYVTQIIMENRRDGASVAWKWLQENQQIPYAEFTDFYKDLSSFIEEQRASYFQIETQCQGIAARHNIMIDTFPNNLLNKIVGLERINFQYGFLSDSTNKIMLTKKENL